MCVAEEAAKRRVAVFVHLGSATECHDGHGVCVSSLFFFVLLILFVFIYVLG